MQFSLFDDPVVDTVTLRFDPVKDISREELDLICLNIGAVPVGNMFTSPVVVPKVKWDSVDAKVKRHFR